jgi:hypothetical protein
MTESTPDCNIEELKEIYFVIAQEMPIKNDTERGTA